MQKVYVVQLSSEEREQLQELIKRGNRKKGQRPSALKLTRALILLKADQADDAPAYTDAEIAEALDISPKTVFNLRKRWGGGPGRSKLRRLEHIGLGTQKP